MDSDLRVQSVDISDSKTSFRKPPNDAASRKYRRHSPDGGSDSSSSDGSPSPRREKGSSKTRDETKYHVRNRSRDHRNVDERGRTSSRSGRFGDQHSKSEKRYRDYRHDSRSHRSDDHQRRGDRYQPSDRGLSGRKHDEKSWRDDDRMMTHDRQKRPEAYERERRSLNDVEIDDPDRRRKPVGRDHDKHRDSKFGLTRGEKSDRDPSTVPMTEDSTSKKKKAGLFEKPIAEDEPSASSNAQVDISQDINAARAAAMKAAELVNKNITSGGFLSTAQKKKLLWGNKKNEAPEQNSGNRWDVPVFSDRERQEKFNKLMGVKGETKSTSHGQPDNKDLNIRTEKEEQLQMDLEKQYTAGLRRRDGRTVGLGL